MATVSPSKPATARASRAIPRLFRRAPLRRALPAAATISAVAVAARLFLDPWYMNYDARYALVWARDLWHASAPDFLAAFAPTPHPLSTAIGSLALPFGHSGDQVVGWLRMRASAPPGSR